MNYEITGHTRLTGLLGSPVSHSISPLMHNKAFQHLGLDYVYLCFDVKENDLKSAVEGLKLLNVRGFNCTMPDKTKMCELADQLSPAARMIGAVNTVVNDDGVLTGHNTDGVGYMQALAETGFSISGKTMTLLGAGGAATAICVQAALDGAGSIRVFNRRGRSWEHAQKLVDSINQNTSCKAQLFDLSDETSLRSSLQESDLLTNATPIGMCPNETLSPLPSADLLHEKLLVSDIIYNPRETLLMRQAKEKGCQTFNGLYMLLYQGAEAFHIWTGVDMPVDLIKKAYFSA
ncbi:MAG: shikimate dehydrogenase [Lachnospiraceae bacterium]|nr:shikimate dehydrogenase [Robinsoniella sp.]MDY3766754.1 shikimate dehydrogenase [Lachnospiraceae bacterium]